MHESGISPKSLKILSQLTTYSGRLTLPNFCTRLLIIGEASFFII